MESFAAIEKINAIPQLTIQDFENGSVSLSDIMEEVGYLKEQIASIRQEMASFLTGLATISSSRKGSQQIFEDNVQKVTALQKNLDDYVERYRKLIPLLELVQKDLNLKPTERQLPSIKPPQNSNVTATGASFSVSHSDNANAAGPKKQAARKRTYTKKSQPANINSNINNMPGQGGVPAMHQLPREGSGSEQQPILL